MNLYNDKRVVLTLDAGGTNFVFNAFCGGKALIEGIRLDAHADNPTPFGRNESSCSSIPLHSGPRQMNMGRPS